MIALVAIFIALRELPLATVVSISFAAPIFTTIFSIFLLSEKVGIFRWLAVIIGFLGIIIITEPGISQLNIYYIFPIIFCLGLSYVAITIRQLSTTEPVWLISFYFSLSITLLSFLTIPQGWIMPSFNHMILLSLIGIFGVIYLSKLRQIGRWSAEMILLFTYNRPNIWPIQDIGLLRAISKNYNKKYLPPESYVRLLNKRFSPYCISVLKKMWE